MSTKHTPGPWSAKKYTNSVLGVIDAVGIFAAEPESPAEMHEIIVERVWGGSLETSDANTRLIAAAPELLAALTALTDWGREHTSPRDDDSPHELLIAASAATAKATEG